MARDPVLREIILDEPDQREVRLMACRIERDEPFKQF